ncbi:hypothetical protein H2248_000785 [Termitomyces sp. 'cryptogamus']|nr:hypothetical protein H2248_000785 [Termitomyces sp. 'cryptogamus']
MPPANLQYVLAESEWAIVQGTKHLCRDPAAHPIVEQACCGQRRAGWVTCLVTGPPVTVGHGLCDDLFSQLFLCLPAYRPWEPSPLQICRILPCAALLHVLPSPPHPSATLFSANISSQNSYKFPPNSLSPLLPDQISYRSHFSIRRFEGAFQISLDVLHNHLPQFPPAFSVSVHVIIAA